MSAAAVRRCSSARRALPGAVEMLPAPPRLRPVRPRSSPARPARSARRKRSSCVVLKVKHIACFEALVETALREPRNKRVPACTSRRPHGTTHICRRDAARRTVRRDTLLDILPRLRPRSGLGSPHTSPLMLTFTSSLRNVTPARTGLSAAASESSGWRVGASVRSPALELLLARGGCLLHLLLLH